MKIEIEITNNKIIIMIRGETWVIPARYPERAANLIGELIKDACN